MMMDLHLSDITIYEKKKKKMNLYLLIKYTKIRNLEIRKLYLDCQQS